MKLVHTSATSVYMGCNARIELAIHDGGVFSVVE